MLKTIVLGAALALGTATFANAAIMPLPIDRGASPIVRVEGGCGPDRWRDENGYCHWKRHGDWGGPWEHGHDDGWWWHHHHHHWD